MAIVIDTTVGDRALGFPVYRVIDSVPVLTVIKAESMSPLPAKLPALLRRYAMPVMGVGFVITACGGFILATHPLNLPKEVAAILSMVGLGVYLIGRISLTAQRRIDRSNRSQSTGSV